MAEPVFLVRDSGGSIAFDSRLAYAGVCVGIVDVPASTAATQSYPDYPGATLKLVLVSGVNIWGVTVDYALGYPRASFDSNVARSYVAFVQ